MLMSWCVVVAAVLGCTGAVPVGVDVRVGPGGVGVDVGQGLVGVDVGGRGLVGVGVGGRELVGVDVGAGGVGVDVASRKADTGLSSSVTKVVDVKVGSAPQDPIVRNIEPVQKTHEVNAAPTPTHHHTHHFSKTHTVDPNFKNTQTYAALDDAGSNLFKGLGNAATALGDFLSRIFGGSRQQ